MTILTPLRLLSSGLCEQVDILDEELLVANGLPRVYHVQLGDHGIDLEPLYAFFVLANCDPGEYWVSWTLESPRGALLVTSMQGQQVELSAGTNSVILQLTGTVVCMEGLREGIYEFAFDLGRQPLARLAFLVYSDD